MPEAAAQVRDETGETTPVLEAVGLRTHFFTDLGVIRAVDGVTLRVVRGETLALVGESGSGKSVTGLSVMRLLGRTSGRIVGGEIFFARRSGMRVDLARIPEDTMRAIRGREIAMVFQDPMSSLNPVFTVGEQIAEVIVQHQHRSHAEALGEAVSLLRLAGLPAAEQRITDYPHQLSGGMRQRVMIAIALACDPLLLIADEPTTALDVTVQAQIVALLARLQRERRLSVIFITHDLRLVSEIADRIAVMYCGQVVEEGRAQDVLSEPRHPYTLALLDCVPSPKRSRTLRGIPGYPADPADPPNGCRFHPRCRFAVEECRTKPPPFLVAEPGHLSRCIRHAELRALR
ncbi:MAG: ABC transporter ATP-binding protein [Acetobacteraceae bacterium]